MGKPREFNKVSKIVFRVGNVDCSESFMPPVTLREVTDGKPVANLSDSERAEIDRLMTADPDIERTYKALEKPVDVVELLNRAAKIAGTASNGRIDFHKDDYMNLFELITQALAAIRKGKE